MSAQSHLPERRRTSLPDQLDYTTSVNLDGAGEIQDYLIFFMTGNPGLITYYEPFLSQLRKSLESSTAQAARFHIAGHSYKGFELSQPDGRQSSPSGLEEQIEFQERLLMHHVKNHQVEGEGTLRVILVGHSVGSYVLLELIQRHLEAVERDPDVEDFDLIGAILVFPTIAEIGQSPIGRFARLVLPIPGFARVIGAMAHALASMLPLTTLHRLIRFVTKFPPHAVNATSAFLRSSLGVRQALFLARDEMKLIKEEDWDNEVWGASTSPGTNKRDTASWNLVLFWGKADQWVADHTRDHIIAARGSQSQQWQADGEQSKCSMVIDDKGMPHDFCTTIENSHIVASRVKGWIDGIIEKHSDAI